MRRLSPIGGLLTMTLLWNACNKDVNEPPALPQSTALLKVSGDDQSAVRGTALSRPFVVRTTDASGDPVADVEVSWAVTEGGGRLSGTSHRTNDQGESSMILTLGAAAGTNRVTASVAGLAGSPATFTATGITPQATALETVSGDDQTAAAGSELPEPLVVRITDASGDPVADVEIAWAVTEGGGSLSATTGSTNAAGQSSVVLTLGATPGTNRVTASAAGLAGSPAAFTATGTAGAAAIEKVDGDRDGLSTNNGVPLVVRVVDSQGGGVPGVTVRWVLTSGPGSLSASSTQSDVMGEASVDYSAGAQLGSTTIEARANGLQGSPVTFMMRTTVFGIAIVGSRYQPNHVSVAVGDTIEWWNLEVFTGLHHTVTSSSEPPGGSAFDSGDLPFEWRYRFVPDAAGTWDYFCAIHGAAESGTITAR